MRIFIPLAALLLTACAQPGPWAETVTATARQHVEEETLEVLEVELMTPGYRDDDGRTFVRVTTSSKTWPVVNLMCDRDDCRAVQRYSRRSHAEAP